jgi:hypothetical protein
VILPPIAKTDLPIRLHEFYVPKLGQRLGRAAQAPEHRSSSVAIAHVTEIPSAEFS